MAQKWITKKKGNESKHIRIQTDRKPREIEVWDVGQTPSELEKQAWNMLCKCRSGFVQNRRCKSDPPHITFHSLFSPLLSVCKEFFLLSFSLYDSPFMLMTVQ